MVKNSGQGTQDDLFGEKQKEEKEKHRRHEVLSRLYPELLKTRIRVEPIDLCIAALNADEWPWVWLAEREANLQLRSESAKRWLEERKPDQKRIGYKTPERGRRPFGECTQLELELDIWQKAKHGGEERDQTRIDIFNFKAAFGKTPRGPNGEHLPRWLWSEEDDRFYDLMQAHTTPRKGLEPSR